MNGPHAFALGKRSREGVYFFLPLLCAQVLTFNGMFGVFIVHESIQSR
jgi:hypothetical protein